MKRGVSLLFLAILILASIGQVFSLPVTEPVHAAATLPSNLDDWIARVTPASGPCQDAITGYKTYISGNKDLPSADNAVSMFREYYYSAHECLSEVDQAWSNPKGASPHPYLTGYAYLQAFQLDPNDIENSVAAYNKELGILQSTSDGAINWDIINPLAASEASLLLINKMAQNPAWVNVITSAVLDQIDILDVSGIIHEKVSTAWENMVNGTLWDPTNSKKMYHVTISSYINGPDFKVDSPANFTHFSFGPAASGIENYRDSTIQYASPTAFYQDAYGLMTTVLALQPLTTDNAASQLKDNQTKQAAASSVSDSITSKVIGVSQDRCGSGPSFLDFSEYFPYIFCNGVLLVMDIGEVLIDGASTLLLRTSGIPGALQNTQKTVFSLPPGQDDKNTFVGPVEQKLVDSSGGQLVRNAYNYVLGITNAAVLLLLIAIALANILQVQVNIYSFKKLLPGLIIGLILANASFFIVRAGLEISGQLAKGLIEQTQKKCTPVYISESAFVSAVAGSTPCGIDAYHATFRAFSSVKQDPTAHLTKIQNGKELPDTSLVFQQAILNFFLWAAAIMVFILAFLFMVRTFVFFFAVSVAPLAFIGLYFPPLGFAWKRWSTLVVNWTFMPLISYFWLWMGFMWFRVVPLDATFLNYLLGYVFGVAMIYQAMKTPFTLAGEAKGIYGKLESKIKGAPKQVWNVTGKKSVEAIGARAMATPLGDAKRFIDKIEENRKTRNEQFSKGYSPNAVKKVESKKRDLELFKQKAEIEIREHEATAKQFEAEGRYRESSVHRNEIEIAQKNIEIEEKKFLNQDGMSRGMRRAIRIVQDEKVRGLEKEGRETATASLGMTSEELLATGKGTRSDSYRELKDAIKDSQAVTKEVVELVRRTNENQYAEGRVGGKTGQNDALLKQWRLESNMRAEGMKKSLDKEAEDRLKRTQYLTILRGKPEKRIGESDDSVAVRGQIYKSAEKIVREALREEVGKRKENVISMTLDVKDDVSKALSNLLSSTPIPINATGEEMENRLKAGAEYVARYEDLNRQANSNKDRIDLDLLKASIDTILQHTRSLTSPGAVKDNARLEGLIAQIDKGLAPKDLDAFKKELKEFTQKSEFVKPKYRDIVKDANDLMRNPAPKPGSTP